MIARRADAIADAAAAKYGSRRSSAGPFLICKNGVDRQSFPASVVTVFLLSEKMPCQRAREQKQSFLSEQSEHGIIQSNIQITIGIY